MKEFIKGFKEGIENNSRNIAVIINSALLGGAYFIGIGVTSITSLISGKKFLDTDTKKDSYWEDYNTLLLEKNNQYRQF